MSLNKITSSEQKNEWMNINCNDLKCTTLEIGGGAISSGSYTPTITLSAGATLSGTSDFNYILVGDVMTISGDFGATTPATGATFSCNFTLPLNKRPVANSVWLTGCGGDGTSVVPGSNQIGILSSVGASVNEASIKYSLSKGVNYTVNLPNCLFQLTGTIRVEDKP